jgi:hypothetical protein
VIRFTETVPAYLRLIAAHLINRMGPPPTSPLENE